MRYKDGVYAMNGTGETILVNGSKASTIVRRRLLPTPLLLLLMIMTIF